MEPANLPDGLRERLVEVGYSEDGVRDALEHPPPPGPLATLVHLFALGGTVPVEELDAALSPVETPSVAGADLVRVHGDRAAATVRLTPVGDLLLLHDPPQASGAEHVAGIGGATLTLAALTPRRRVDSVLDLGTGCGVQALLAARHARKVVATDLNPRALRFTLCNARLNAIDGLEALPGDLFEPVGGSSFDVIAANPPFVISPDRDYLYRDSGLPGDSVSSRVVGEAPALLREGGYATILCDWVHSADEHWSERPRRWVEGQGCDAWIVAYRSLDPGSYAAHWNAPLAAVDPDAFRAAVERWREHHHRLGIDAIATGAITLRRRSGANWVRADEMTRTPTGRAGDHVLRVFEARDALDRLPDDRCLLDWSFTPVAPQRAEQVLAYRNGGYVVEAVRLTLHDGAGVDATVPPEHADLFLRLHAGTALRDVIEQVEGVGGDDGKAFRAGALTTVRHLFELGFLEATPASR